MKITCQRIFCWVLTTMDFSTESPKICFHQQSCHTNAYFKELWPTLFFQSISAQNWLGCVFISILDAIDCSWSWRRISSVRMSIPSFMSYIYILSAVFILVHQHEWDISHTLICLQNSHHQITDSCTIVHWGYRVVQIGPNLFDLVWKLPQVLFENCTSSDFKNFPILKLVFQSK